MATHEGAVLVVDDDLDIREALHDVLTDEGYETVEARDGRQALDYLRTNPLPAVILLDWNMAPMNAPQFMTELAREDAAISSVPVVLLTADAKAPDKAKYHPFSGYLTKPVSLDSLFEVLERYCG
jgi:CheY-like chemotaxis protein